ncbi:MAG: class I SAM-dependent methyltransferase [Bradyrhizobiaceae bacterium]|nr:class I SAM-dependent methyltransferase [Bradyrhizobiaceae bacterium]
MTWVDCDRNVLVQRYDRIAGLIPFFEWLFFLPSGLRRNAVDRLDLKSGDSVLEVGCGTGRNLPFLQAAVGSHGRVYGIDLSPGMLRRAQELTSRNRWTNVTLKEADAIDYIAPRRLNGVLFSLSYNTIPHHRAVLHHVWNQLRPGGSLVIMDARPPPGRWGELILPFSVWLMKRTVLGNPYIQPWKHLATLSDDFEMEEFLFGSYYICRGVRRERWSLRRNERSSLLARSG